VERTLSGYVEEVGVELDERVAPLKDEAHLVGLATLVCCLTVSVVFWQSPQSVWQSARRDAVEFGLFVQLL